MSEYSEILRKKRLKNIDMTLDAIRFFKWVKKELMGESDEYCNGRVFTQTRPKSIKNGF